MFFSQFLLFSRGAKYRRRFVKEGDLTSYFQRVILQKFGEFTSQAKRFFDSLITLLPIPSLVKIGIYRQIGVLEVAKNVN